MRDIRCKVIVLKIVHTDPGRSQQNFPEHRKYFIMTIADRTSRIEARVYSPLGLQIRPGDILSITDGITTLFTRREGRCLCLSFGRNGGFSCVGQYQMVFNEQFDMTSQLQWLNDESLDHMSRERLERHRTQVLGLPPLPAHDLLAVSAPSDGPPGSVPGIGLSIPPSSSVPGIGLTAPGSGMGFALAGGHAPAPGSGNAGAPPAPGSFLPPPGAGRHSLALAPGGISLEQLPPPPGGSSFHHTHHLPPPPAPGPGPGPGGPPFHHPHHHSAPHHLAAPPGGPPSHHHHHPHHHPHHPHHLHHGPPPPPPPPPHHFPPHHGAPPPGGRDRGGLPPPAGGHFAAPPFHAGPPGGGGPSGPPPPKKSRQ
ncbi:hypothetical protein H696_02350 [Fonticula alba]|uniref:Uncharacterized protein n=1 Tax=Fonticula alba TaxID=691883 RepID=A0A058ZD87_FONAL|nr:hypothetical protein H696_02350 [Fonticula alba]KCV71402.1 hypothetical protein H696_02350 [Fonticula alba]|eukprot:XP_009494525.1 hypothetical protein H696_02350 [Fonticula alba]